MSGSPSTPASKAPVFWQCPSCGFLSSDPGFRDAAGVCPECGAAVGKPRAFPPDGQRRLDDRIRSYNREHEWEITVILAAALLEALLEDILDRIMTAHGADVAIRSTLLDTVRTIGTRISRLFPDLTGMEFEEAAAELGFRDFPKRWRKTRELRNAFIHDTPYRDIQESIGEDAARQAVLLLDEAYRLFVLLNNKFVADGRRHAGEKAHVSLHGEPTVDAEGAVER
jgi:hypothetical protein